PATLASRGPRCGDPVLGFGFPAEARSRASSTRYAPGMSGVWFVVGVDATRLGTCLSAPVRRHYREPMSDLAPAAAPTVVAAGTSARRGESRWWVVARTAFPFVVVALAWELTAHLGVFPRKLFPPLEEVAAALVRLAAEGVLPHHVLDTLLRLLAGFALAAVAGVAIGFAMGRSRRAE